MATENSDNTITVVMLQYLAIYTVKKQRGGFTFGPVGVKFHF